MLGTMLAQSHWESQRARKPGDVLLSHRSPLWVGPSLVRCNLSRIRPRESKPLFRSCTLRVTGESRRTFHLAVDETHFPSGQEVRKPGLHRQLCHRANLPDALGFDLPICLSGGTASLRYLLTSNTSSIQRHSTPQTKRTPRPVLEV